MIKNHALESQKNSGSQSTPLKEYRDVDEECSTDEWYSNKPSLIDVSPSTEMITKNNEMNLMLSGNYSEDVDDYSNEPPLLEELGIRFDHIFLKTQAVMIPTKV